jgi:CO/xanthine dehydrogenase Mo-binding subunit
MGEGVALVAAKSQEIAEEAAKLVKVDYEVLPAVFTPEEALDENAPKLYKEGNLLCEYKTSKGNIDTGFKEAEYIFEREYSTQRVQHVAIEPEAAVAFPDLDGITVYVPTNDPFNARRIIAEALGVNAVEVKVILPTIGGSFGGKSYDSWVLGARVALAAIATGRKCKLVYTREESIIEGTKRHPYKLKYKVGVNSSGILTAMEINITGDGGAYKSKSFPVASRSCIEATGPYIVPNVKTNIVLAYTNNVYSDALRGFGSPQVAFSSEVMMDEIASELKLDPIEFRKQNALKENSISGVGQRMRDVSLEECLDKVMASVDWEKRKAQIMEERKNSDSKKVKGLGIALLHRGEAFGAAGQGLDASAVSMHVQKDGSAMILTSMSEIGNGCHNLLRKIVSQTLGLKIERIKVRTVDTSCVPDSGPIVATRGTVVIGNAMKAAALEVREKLIKIAAEKLGVSEEKIDLKEEYAYSINDADKKISYFDLIKEIYARGDHTYARGWYVIDGLKWNKQIGQGEAYLSYVYGACAAEVEVDLETGQVTVEDFAAAHDVGHAFDRSEVVGQINGGISMGLGYGIFEEVNMKNGMIKNTNYDTYIIPTAADMPNTTPIVVEHPSITGPYGARGLGEPVACAVAPAIINAIADAAGFYIRDIPASLEKVLKYARKNSDKNTRGRQ